MSSGGARSLFLLGHKWGSITSKGEHDGLGLSSGVFAPGVGAEWGSHSCIVCRECHPRKIFEDLLSKSRLLVPRAPKSWPLLVCKMVQ